MAGVTCAICLEIYDLQDRRPVVGVCGHSICFECFAHIQKSSVQRCPVCSKAAAFSKLKFNYQMMELIENANTTRKQLEMVKSELAAAQNAVSSTIESSTSDSSTGDLPEKIREMALDDTNINSSEEEAWEKSSCKNNKTDLRTSRKFRGVNLYVKNLESTVDDDDLHTLFESYGYITSAKVVTDDFGVSKGFGFVSFADTEDGMSAISAMNMKMLGSKRLHVSFAENKEHRKAQLSQFATQNTVADRRNIQHQRHMQNQSSRYSSPAPKCCGINLYVKNLESTVDDKALHKLFESYGHITSAKVSKDDVGVSKGFGFVSFENTAEGISAISAMNRKMLGSKCLYVGLAQKKDDRKTQLAMEFMTQNTVSNTKNVQSGQNVQNQNSHYPPYTIMSPWIVQPPPPWVFQVPHGSLQGPVYPRPLLVSPNTVPPSQVPHGSLQGPVYPRPLLAPPYTVPPPQITKMRPPAVIANQSPRTSVSAKNNLAEKPETITEASTKTSKASGSNQIKNNTTHEGKRGSCAVSQVAGRRFPKKKRTVSTVVNVNVCSH